MQISPSGEELKISEDAFNYMLWMMLLLVEVSGEYTQHAGASTPGHRAPAEELGSEALGFNSTSSAL